MKVQLREDYQVPAFTSMRDAIRGGAKAIVVNAPTGSGKTVIASALMELVMAKGNRANFVVDRLSLVDQTSDTFDRYGLEHGVIQSEHPRYRPSLPIQICSAQTLLRRGWPESNVDVIDECHILSEDVKKRIRSKATVIVGLTATPFTKGMGKWFDAVVNVTTTNRLIEQGWLAPYRIFSCVEPDMTGVKVTRKGEWDDVQATGKALEVVGDVVQEYLKHGEGRKFICSGVTIAHCEELTRQFQAAGINVCTYTADDRPEDRKEVVAEFRKPDSSIRGLVTVTAASRGFDVPDVSCVIMARPLRKSFAEHLQLFGRGLRICEGKTDCIVLDHSGNCARFWQDMLEFFENGISELDDGKPKKKPKAAEKQEAELQKCPTCRHLHKPMPFCPQCGHQYPPRKVVQHVPGTLKELIATRDAVMLRRELWPQICWYVREHKSPRDDLHAQKMAQGMFISMVGEPARARYELTTPKACSREVALKIQNEHKRWVIARRAAERKNQQTEGASA